MHSTNPPIAKQIPYTSNVHDIAINDEYSWLRAPEWPNNIEDQDVLNYLQQENNYCAEFFAPLDNSLEIFYQELVSRIKLEDCSVHIRKGNYYYYTRTEATKNYAIYCRLPIDSLKEEVVLDTNELSDGKSFTSVKTFAPCPNDKLVAYGVDYTGNERYQIYIYDTITKRLLKETIPSTIGPIVWHETILGFFYSPTDAQWRHNKILFHKIGSNPKEDKLIFHEPSSLYNVSVQKSSSKKYIFINISGHDSSEVHYVQMDDLSLTPKLFSTRKEGTIYTVEHNGEYFYRHTNADAKNFCIERVQTQSIKPDTKWQIFIAEKPDAYLNSFSMAKDYLILNYQQQALPKNIVYEITTGRSKTISFIDEAFVANAHCVNFKHNHIHVHYSSLAQPNTTYQYNFHLDSLKILKTHVIPGYNPADYKVKRIYANNGSVQIPISLIYKKSLFKNDGSNPLYLYGYGSYGIRVEPMFRNSAVSLIDRGFVYAIAHIRGGDDLGYDWYESAKFLQKKNTFTDFITVAEGLIAKKYTSAGNIVIAGGSAGGMLIGNVINSHPHLFKAAIAHVPFVDVLNTMLDEDLPLTPGEFKEWGNPKEVEYFHYIKSYCPYNNVKKQDYPHLFITAGLYDPRVGYWEAAKWVARLRQNQTNASKKIIFKTNMNFGHSGASGRFAALREVAEDLAFIKQVFKP